MNNLINGYGVQSRLYSLTGNNTTTPFQKEQKQQLIQKQYNDIYEHELAHKNTAGEFGGAIVIENNADGIPVGGHVDVKMPVLDKSNPDKTIKHADIVIRSAMAPKDPSNQDYKVAAEAQSIKSQAQNEKVSPSNNGDENKYVSGKNLNLIA